MSLLITQAEIEELPDDPRQKFVCVEQICRQRYEDLAAGEDNWNFVKDCRLRYMSSVLSAAKYLEIKPICDIELPKRKNFDNDEYDDFVLQIEFYSMQLMLEGAETNSQISVVLQGGPRDRVITLIAHLKEHVGRLSINAGRKDALLTRIAEFERELDRPKIRFATVAAMTLFVIGTTADLGGATDVVRKIISEIQEVIGITKIDQDMLVIGRRSVNLSAKKLIAPRKDSFSSIKVADYDLDDDIPF